MYYKFSLIFTKIQTDESNFNNILKRIRGKIRVNWTNRNKREMCCLLKPVVNQKKIFFLILSTRSEKWSDPGTPPLPITWSRYSTTVI